MSVLDKIEEKGLLHYYDLCISKKDWSQGDLKKALDFIAQQYSAGHISNMLEIGCGVGNIVPHLPTGLQYFGLDPTEYSIQQAHATYPQYDFKVGYAENLPFPDSSFDLVYSFQTLQMFRDPRGALKEITRVIRPGGYALFIAPNLECPWSHLNSIRHYSYSQKFILALKRFKDLALRFFGMSSFRLIPQTYVEAAGRFEKKDDDLKYLVSTREVMRLFKSLAFRNIATKKSERTWMRCIGPLRYYRGGMYLGMQKHNAIES